MIGSIAIVWFDFACEFYNHIQQLWKVGEICVNLGLLFLLNYVLWNFITWKMTPIEQCSKDNPQHENKDKICSH